jgi:hypothetical protein
MICAADGWIPFNSSRFWRDRMKRVVPTTAHQAGPMQSARTLNSVRVKSATRTKGPEAMKSQTRIGWFVATAIVLAAASAQAQPRWGQEATPRAGACFYQDKDFRGPYFCVRQGDSLDRVPGGVNDSISSIRVFGPVDVVVFKDARFRGPSARFSTDVRNLTREGWNDLISSMRVGNSSWGGGGGGGGDRGDGGRPPRPPVWGNDDMPREGACFYSEPDFRGQRFCVPRGGSYTLLPPGFNDRIKSIRVQRAMVLIFEDKDFDGRNLRLTQSAPDLGRNWSNRLSSLRVN